MIRRWLTVLVVCWLLTSGQPVKRLSIRQRWVQNLTQQIDSTTDGDGGNPRSNLLSFVRALFAGVYQTAAHHVRIAESLQWVEDTPDSILIVTMPPRHGKSTLISEHWPPYLLGRHPNWRIIAASAAQSLANDFSTRAREIIMSPNWPFPRVRLRRGQSRIEHWNIEEDLLNKRGGYDAVGAAGQLTGRGANVLIIDDPVKNFEEAMSPVMRRKNWEWFIGTAFPRLEPGGRVVVVGTRWHEDDLIGRIIKFATAEPLLSQNLRILHMPAIDRKGLALWPERYNVARLAVIRAFVGAFNWRAQYQGDPDEESGNVIDPALFPIDTTPVAPAMDWYLQSWDTSFGEGSDPDYSACITFAVGPDGARIVDVWRGIVKFTDLTRMIVSKHQQYGARVVLIENKSSGISAQQYLKRNHKRIPVVAVPVPAGEGKVMRANECLPVFESARISISSTIALYSDFMSEIRRFPNDRYDDQVDALTQGTAYLYLPKKVGGRARSRNYRKGRDDRDDFDEQLEQTRRGQ